MPNSMDILHTVTFVPIREFLSNHTRLNAIKQTFFHFEQRGIRMIGEEVIDPESVPHKMTVWMIK